MLRLSKRSGRADLNRRPPGPEPGALAGLSHAPNKSDYTRPTLIRQVICPPSPPRTTLAHTYAQFTHKLTHIHENEAKIEACDVIINLLETSSLTFFS